MRTESGLKHEFSTWFRALTDFAPLRWQARLFDRLSSGDVPSVVDLPTGLGKTSVIAIWLLARAVNASPPRRLVYVVDRRAVVDQATDIAAEIKQRIDSLPELAPLRQALRLTAANKLPVSTLRGQLADNREWLDDPSQTAIVVGTIDMIGSRLLFGGYGVSRKMRPFHAGLLGADSLVVLDEAHLCPPFEAMVRAVEGERALASRLAIGESPMPKLQVMALSATARRPDAGRGIFGLTDDDRDDEIVQRRLGARKTLTLETKEEAADLVPALAAHAWTFATTPVPARVVVFCNSREDALAVKRDIDGRIGKAKTGRSELMVGARRVFEREQLSDWLTQSGFLRTTANPTEPVVLVATSAGEVGVDLDAQHLVCDLVEWERMVQRFGRVNRRGDGDAAVAVVAAPHKGAKPEEWTERLDRLRAPFDLLGSQPQSTGLDVSPGAITALRARAAADPQVATALARATSTAPLHPALSRALVDAWALTSLATHTGRPELEPWLRGWVADDRPQTTVIWRTWLPVRMAGEAATPKEQAAFFEAAPPHVTETLETETDLVRDWLLARAGAVVAIRAKPPSESMDAAEAKLRQLRDDHPVVFVLATDNSISDTYTLLQLVGVATGSKRGRDVFDRRLAGMTIVVDARLAGLAGGMLDSGAADVPRTADDGGEWLAPAMPEPSRETPPTIRFRIVEMDVESADDPATRPDGANGWFERYRFDHRHDADGSAASQLVIQKWMHDSANEDDRATGRAQLLVDHRAETAAAARLIAEGLGLDPRFGRMLTIAARLHDEGKRSLIWQHAFNAGSDGIYAKTTGPINPRLLRGYRHEFGSLRYVRCDPEFLTLEPDLQDLALHLVVAHHGFARPIISVEGNADRPPMALKAEARDVAERFMRLQRAWGPWGLAWWESLLRAADQQASRANDARPASPAGKVA